MLLFFLFELFLFLLLLWWSSGIDNLEEVSRQFHQLICLHTVQHITEI